MKPFMKLLFLLFMVPSLLAQDVTSSSGPGPMGVATGHGGLHASTGTTSNTSGVPIKMVGTYDLTGQDELFDEPVEGRLRYIGTLTRHFIFSIHLSFTSDTNNIIVIVEGAKNGTPIGDSAASRKIGTGTDVGALSDMYIVELATNDYLEVFIDSGSGNPDIIISHLTLIAWDVN